MKSANERPRLGTEGVARHTDYYHFTTAANASPTPSEAIGDRYPDAARSSVKSGMMLPCAIQPLLSIADLAQILNVSRSAVERMRSSGLLPPPDLNIGKMSRWKAATVRVWIDTGGKGGGR